MRGPTGRPGASSTRLCSPIPATHSTWRAQSPRATSAISAPRCTDQPHPPRITRSTSAAGTSSRSTRAAAIPAAPMWCVVKRRPRRHRGYRGTWRRIPPAARSRIGITHASRAAGQTTSPGTGPLFGALYNAHADIVLSGHDHVYERYAQQDPNGVATTAGIRQFVVGTGGESLFTMLTKPANLQVSDQNDFGVMVLTLHASSYDWAFKRLTGPSSTAAPPRATGAGLDRSPHAPCATRAHCRSAPPGRRCNSMSVRSPPRWRGRNAAGSRSRST